MARSAEETAWLLNAMAGFDEKDSTSIEMTRPDFEAELGQDIKGLKVGVPAEYFGDGLDEGVEKAVRDAIAQLEAQGRKSLKSVCRTRIWRCRLIMCWPRRKPRPICRVSTVCVMAIVATTRRICKTCICVPVPKVWCRSEAPYHGGRLRLVGRLL